jgi:hypothetical protein
VQGAVASLLAVNLSVAPAVPAESNQGRPTSGVFITREAIDRAVAASIPQAAAPGWERVRALAPGQEITVMLGDGTAVHGYFVKSGTTLTVVNALEGLGLDHSRDGFLGQVPGRTSRAVIEIASTPDEVEQSATSRTKEHHGVSLGPDGLFRGDKKLAERSAIVRDLDLPDVVEVRREIAHPHPAAITGLALMAGGLVLSLASHGTTSSYPPEPQLTLGGVMGGAMIIAGAITGVVGSNRPRPRTVEVIYRSGKH